MLLRKILCWPILCFGFALLSARFVSEAAEKPSDGGKPGASGKAKAGDDIFANAGFLRIKIEVPKDGMSTLRRSGHWGGAQKDRPVVRATVSEGDRVYTNVALHLKGAAGSFQPVDYRPAFTLNFDKFAKGQEFHGLDKISLNNSVQDPSYLSEKICRELFLAAGVPAPQATHARLEFNGRDLGVYVLVEGWGKKFLKRYFDDTKGNLYDGGFRRDIMDGLDVNSGDNRNNTSDLKRLAEAAMEPDRAKRMERLEQVLDVERFFRMMALEVIMSHWDGYALNKNNFRVFHDAARDKMIFMPHGMDQMFGYMRMTDPNSPIAPPELQMQGLVARAVMQTPAGWRRYLETMSQLMTNVLFVEAITNRVREIAAQVRPAFAERGGDSARRFDRETEFLCSRIGQRVRSVRQQLAFLTNPLAFDHEGVARLQAWQSRKDYGNPVFEQSQEAEGRRVFHINMNSGSGVGSWRTRVLLEGGRYRLEARARTRGVTPDPGDVRGGAGLRISNRRFAQKLTNTTDWTNLGFEFEIADGAIETELMCELRAARGEVWFDVDSIRLLRK